MAEKRKMFGKKKPVYEDMQEEQEPGDEEAYSDEQPIQAPRPTVRPRSQPVEQEAKPAPLTKEEIGALTEYHQARATELMSIYRRLPSD
jgi:hypothetical protein